MIDLTWRNFVTQKDVATITHLVQQTNVFSSEEIRVAGELAEEKIIHGENSSYNFLFVENGIEVVGYSCFGLIPFTDHRFDLYWIVVNPSLQKNGIGSLLLKKTEETIVAMQGRQLYADTSSRKIYEPTHKFYLRNNFLQVAELKDYYRDGDNKIIYWKQLL